MGTSQWSKFRSRPCGISSIRSFEQPLLLLLLLDVFAPQVVEGIAEDGRWGEERGDEDEER